MNKAKIINELNIMSYELDEMRSSLNDPANLTLLIEIKWLLKRLAKEVQEKESDENAK